MDPSGLVLKGLNEPERAGSRNCRISPGLSGQLRVSERLQARGGIEPGAFLVLVQDRAKTPAIRAARAPTARRAITPPGWEGGHSVSIPGPFLRHSGG